MAEPGLYCRRGLVYLQIRFYNHNNNAQTCIYLAVTVSTIHKIGLERYRIREKIQVGRILY